MTHNWDHWVPTTCLPTAFVQLHLLYESARHNPVCGVLYSVSTVQDPCGNKVEGFEPCTLSFRLMCMLWHILCLSSGPHLGPIRKCLIILETSFSLSSRRVLVILETSFSLSSRRISLILETSFSLSSRRVSHYTRDELPGAGIEPASFKRTV